ncbi:M10 family metallopeptidase C-terminal domain-containing protein [Methylopila sp. M107]|uniref:calcium-binding protein n=1 Tax=Methylopila sp. M107 TaxID=1101190 RepID=UPI00035E5019|nr:M10 family metallopeptidase C-terminal domain-containing protein [Methylopila sp. M107]
MLIGRQEDGAAPRFEISRAEGGVTLDFSYKLAGFWPGALESTLGEDGGSATGKGGSPIVLSYSAALEDGVTTEGSYVLEDFSLGTSVVFDFTVTAYSSAGNFAGTAVADYVFGSELDDALTGAKGEDVLKGDAGQDTLDGGGGADILRGGDGDDLIKGGAGHDLLVGNRGDDVLIGGAGDDVLSGRWGADTLTGGDGDDVFVFATGLGADEVDLITDFTTGSDKISLDVDVFLTLEGLDGLTSDQFAVTEDGLATSADQRIIYNSKTGELFYDPDGSGSEAAILFAKLAPETDIDDGDFLIV